MVLPVMLGSLLVVTLSWLWQICHCLCPCPLLFLSFSLGIGGVAGRLIELVGHFVVAMLVGREQ